MVLQKPIGISDRDVFNVSQIEDQEIKSIDSLEVNVFLREPMSNHITQLESENYLETHIRKLLRLFVLICGFEIDLRAGSWLNKWPIEKLEILNTGVANLGQVTETTKIILRNVKFINHLTVEKPLGGISDIRSHLEAEILNKCSVLLIGPSGSGKTSLIYSVASTLNANLFELKGIVSKIGEDVISERVGHILQMAKISNRPSIVLIEDVEQFCPKSSNAKRSASNLTSYSVLQGIDQLRRTDNRIVVICTTRNVEVVEPKLRRPGRIEREIYIKVPNEVRRKEIITVLLAGTNALIEDQNDLVNFIASSTPAFLGGDLLELMKAAKRCSENGCISMDNVNKALKKVTPVCVRTNSYLVALNRELRLDSIGGLRKLKATLDMAIFKPLAHPDKFIRFNLSLPKGVLMYGPPGCAKTTVAKCLANEMNRHLIAISAAQIYSPYVGDSEQLLAQIFHQARMCAPSILFIDEIGE